MEHLQAFHARTKPGGPGWKAIAPGVPLEGGRRGLIAWVGGIVGVYGALFGVGRLLLGPRLEAIPFLLAMVLGFVAVAWAIDERGAHSS